MLVVQPLLPFYDATCLPEEMAFYLRLARIHRRSLIVVLSKADELPAEKHSDAIDRAKHLIVQLMNIAEEIPVFVISCVGGRGLPAIRQYFENKSYERRSVSSRFPAEGTAFLIDDVLLRSCTRGLILGGITRQALTVGDEFLLGPLRSKPSWLPVRVASIHIHNVAAKRACPDQSCTVALDAHYEKICDSSEECNLTTGAENTDAERSSKPVKLGVKMKCCVKAGMWLVQRGSNVIDTLALEKRTLRVHIHCWANDAGSWVNRRVVVYVHALHEPATVDKIESLGMECVVTLSLFRAVVAPSRSQAVLMMGTNFLGAGHVV